MRIISKNNEGPCYHNLAMNMVCDLQDKPGMVSDYFTLLQGNKAGTVEVKLTQDMNGAPSRWRYVVDVNGNLNTQALSGVKLPTHIETSRMDWNELVSVLQGIAEQYRRSAVGLGLDLAELYAWDDDVWFAA